MPLILVYNFMEEIKIKREFLEELLDDEIELWNLANNRGNDRLMGNYQKNIDQIKALLLLPIAYIREDALDSITSEIENTNGESECT